MMPFPSQGGGAGRAGLAAVLGVFLALSGPGVAAAQDLAAELSSAAEGARYAASVPNFYLPFLAVGFACGRGGPGGGLAALAVFAAAAAAGALFTDGRMFPLAPPAKAGLLLCGGLILLVPEKFVRFVRPLAAAAAGGLGGVLVGLDGLLANGPWAGYAVGAGFTCLAFMACLVALRGVLDRGQTWFGILSRVLGSWFVAAGVLLLGLAL